MPTCPGVPGRSLKPLKTTLMLGSAPLGTAAEAEPPRPKKPVLPHIARRAYRIVEFCAAHGISRSKYYELKDAGMQPHETDIDGVIVITEEDAAVWRKQRSAATPIIRPKKPSAARGDGRSRARHRPPG
jgi:hypothetical protein